MPPTDLRARAERLLRDLGVYRRPVDQPSSAERLAMVESALNEARREGAREALGSPGCGSCGAGPCENPPRGFPCLAPPAPSDAVESAPVSFPALPIDPAADALVDRLVEERWAEMPKRKLGAAESAPVTYRAGTVPPVVMVGMVLRDPTDVTWRVTSCAPYIELDSVQVFPLRVVDGWPLARDFTPACATCDGTRESVSFVTARDALSAQEIDDRGLEPDQSVSTSRPCPACTQPEPGKDGAQ